MQPRPKLLAVTNFKKFQHYQKSGSQPMLWIKLYAALLNDYAFNQLPESDQIHLVKLWLLAGQLSNRIPNDEKWIAGRIGSTSLLHLDRLVRGGWLHDADRTALSMPPRDDLFPDSTDLALETSSRVTLDDSRASRVEQSRVEQIKTMPGFVLFWEVWRETGRRRYRGKTETVWRSMHLEPKTAQIVAAVHRWMQYRKWKAARNEWCADFQDPHRYLANERYTDELPDEFLKSHSSAPTYSAKEMRKILTDIDEMGVDGIPVELRDKTAQ